MRSLCGLALAVGCVTIIGCAAKPHQDPTVKAFVGRVVHNGQPVKFADDEKAELQLVYQKRAESFGVPLKGDGSFQIGWMPIGPYSARLVTEKHGKRGQMVNYNVPGGLTIEDGRTDYMVELGEQWKH